MLPYEFKAWFEGFSENMKGPPTKQQWERIQKKVKEISSHPSWYWSYYPSYPWLSPTGVTTTTGGTGKYISSDTTTTLYNSGVEDFRLS